MAAFHRQGGAGSLLMVLVLMLATGMVTLAVARTRLGEQQIAANALWHDRLLLQAEAGLAQGIDLLLHNTGQLAWQQGANGERSSRVNATSTLPGTRTELSFRQAAGNDRYLSLQATSLRTDGSGIRVQVSQQLRLLSILTPLAERAPPLVVGGCLTSLPASLDLRPLNADSHRAATAAWLGRNTRCPLPANTDLHGGSLARDTPGGDLWQRLFTVSRKDYLTLAQAEQRRPPARRRYWIAPDHTAATAWGRSLGSPDSPVVLYFPAQAGCPGFAPGTRIHGVIYIEGSCSRTPFAAGLAVFGLLAIEGSLDTRASIMNINHIQAAGRQFHRLDFPLLHIVRVPGSWRDFGS